ncbi:4'-phosphopantetheinyl transferase superfamily protein [Granulicella sp. S190]|uniref:4'-phosphopantetheinyl transferase family protein n=1 Tax=Granulicella sp. S190 TaxID=1747226 RepID=UPI00131C9D11|nr:4'-phosphopantetheinyl transferase superfamily protein [Granulicella sp. S190]
MMAASQRNLCYPPMAKDWKRVDTLPRLEAGEVQLWRIDLPGTNGLNHRLAPFLTQSEQLSASRYKMQLSRDHCVVGRACLRILLAATTGLAPQSIPITTGVQGKPEIPILDGAAISFNVAHSKDTILIALTRTGAIGVDVEYFDRSTDIMEVAQHNFTAKETGSLAAIVDLHTRHKTFYRYWTRKEAVLKADGRGLIASLSSFDISFESVHLHPVRISESTGDQGTPYFVSDVDLSDSDSIIEAAAAIAFESAESPLRRLVFPLNRQW